MPGMSVFYHTMDKEILAKLILEPVDKKLREYTNQTGYDM
jgi:hypothetical protein